MSRLEKTRLPDIAIPPGEFLLETIGALGISQAELAKRMGRPVQAINEIIKGKKAITGETALQLESVLGTPAYIWLNLDRQYQLNKARLERADKLKVQASRLSQFPVAEMVKYGWINRFNDKVDQTLELLNFLGVASLDALETTRFFEATLHAAYRRSSNHQASPHSMVAWLRKGWLEADKIDTAAFNAKELDTALINIRPLTRKKPEEFEPELKVIMASCGVALVFVPHLPKSYVSGATYWLSSNKAVIQLSLRFKTNDHFWFSLYHEAAHLLLHGKKMIFLDDWKTKSDSEDEANERAANKLINSSDYKRLLEYRNKFSRKTIEEFAEQINIAPGIVVGRLQHDGLLPYAHLNDLKDAFIWANESWR
ncbi:MAG: HigA family addiction module antitoxin [Candidatus Aquicultor sp.]